MLREFEADDAIVMQTYQEDPRFLEHYETKPDARFIIEKSLEWSNQIPRRNFQLAICPIGNDRLIGTVGLRSAAYPDGEAEVGFALDPKSWGKGFAREAVTAMIQFAIQNGITKVHAITNPSNTAAITLVESLGFRHCHTEGNEAFYKVQSLV